MRNLNRVIKSIIDFYGTDCDIKSLDRSELSELLLNLFLEDPYVEESVKERVGQLLDHNSHLLKLEKMHAHGLHPQVDRVNGEVTWY